jgi:hypothetical protein
MIIILAQSFYFCFRSLGERVPKVLHGYFFAIAKNVIKNKIKAITDPVQDGKGQDGK